MRKPNHIFALKRSVDGRIDSSGVNEYHEECEGEVVESAMSDSEINIMNRVSDMTISTTPIHEVSFYDEDTSDRKESKKNRMLMTEESTSSVSTIFAETTPDTERTPEWSTPDAFIESANICLQHLEQDSPTKGNAGIDLFPALILPRKKYSVCYEKKQDNERRHRKRNTSQPSKHESFSRDNVITSGTEDREEFSPKTEIKQKRKRQRMIMTLPGLNNASPCLTTSPVIGSSSNKEIQFSYLRDKNEEPSLQLPDISPSFSPIHKTSVYSFIPPQIANEVVLSLDGNNVDFPFFDGEYGKSSPQCGNTKTSWHRVAKTSIGLKMRLPRRTTMSPSSSMIYGKENFSNIFAQPDSTSLHKKAPIDQV